MSERTRAVVDPGLYRKLSEPVESVDEAKRLGTEFYEEVCKLREKHHVSDMVIAFSVNAKDENGEEVPVSQTGYRGGMRVDALILALVKQTRFGAALYAFIEELTVAAMS